MHRNSNHRHHLLPPQHQKRILLLSLEILSQLHPLLNLPVVHLIHMGHVFTRAAHNQTHPPGQTNNNINFCRLSLVIRLLLGHLWVLMSPAQRSLEPRRMTHFKR